MNRRKFLVGTAGAGVLLAGVGAWLRPADKGAPYSDYFARLNRELKTQGPMRPVMLIDLDRLDHNIDVVMQSVRRAGKSLRLVEKSLPSPQLLDYIAKRAGTQRLMSFHQPFLNHDAERFPNRTSCSASPCRCVPHSCSTRPIAARSTRPGSCSGCSTPPSDWRSTWRWPRP